MRNYLIMVGESYHQASVRVGTLQEASGLVGPNVTAGRIVTIEQTVHGVTHKNTGDAQAFIEKQLTSVNSTENS